LGDPAAPGSLCELMTSKIEGKVIVLPDASHVAREAAQRIAGALRSAIADKGHASLALSGGTTPRAAYTLLAREPAVNWTSVEIFWVDERAVPPTDDRSNYHWAKMTLLDAARIGDTSVHRMPADQPDLDGAARAYERTIREHVEANGEGVPAFDALVLGVGDDGHTASLFPGESTVGIVDRLVAPVPPDTGREARLTLTPTAIEHARRVFVLAVGRSKRSALNRVWAADGSLSQTPARVIRRCRGELTWIVDQDLAPVD
jgi:6-phosphogluconolactonase